MKTIKIMRQLLFAVFVVFTTIPFSLRAQNHTNIAPFKSYFYLQPNVGLSQYFGDINLKDYWNPTPQLGAGVVGDIS